MTEELRDSSEQGGTPRDLLRAIFRRKWIFIVVVGATLAWVVYSAARVEPEWESAAKLLVQRGYQPSAFNPDVRMVTWEEEFASEVETVNSDRIRNRAEEILAAQGTTDAAGAPIKIDAGSVGAETRGKAHIIMVRYRGTDPNLVQSVVRALTQAYREFRTQTRRPDPTPYLQEEIDDVGEEIASWEQRRAEFLESEGVVELPEERTGLLTERRNLEQQLAATQASIAEHRAQVDWLRTYVDGEREDPTSGLYAFQDPNDRGEPILLTLRRKIVDAQTEYLTARSQFTDTHPQVQAMRDKLDGLQKALATETSGYIDHLTGRLDAERAREAALMASLDYVNETLSSFPSREAQLDQLDRTIGKLRDSYSALVSRQLDAITTRVGASPWDVVVLQDAVEPYPVLRFDYVRMAVVLIFSIFVAIGLVLLRDNLDHTFRERGEVESYVGLPVLASISRFRK